jgi:GTPase SAR1 family protein/Ca2+-binding EF-hand superfamily protein
MGAGRFPGACAGSSPTTGNVSTTKPAGSVGKLRSFPRVPRPLLLARTAMLHHTLFSASKPQNSTWNNLSYSLEVLSQSLLTTGASLYFHALIMRPGNGDRYVELPSRLTSLTMPPVRICLCGDDGVGKSSIVTSLVKDVFVTAKIQAVLPQVTLPPTLGTPDNVTTTIVDTSALPHERDALRKELRKSNVILLVYSDHYSYERVALFWMPYFRSLGVNVPVVLCANKSDVASNGNTSQVVSEEMLPVMNEFKEIDSCIRTSAKEHHNINEVFFLCQRAVTHPIAPLYDSKENILKPAAISALQRVFHLCDTDKDGYWNDQEIHDFQIKCFEKPLGDDDLTNIKNSMERFAPGATGERGIDEKGFLLLNKIFAEKGRHETIWIILRKFHYTDSLSLQDTFLHPKFDVPQFSSAELSPSGYRFFVDLFLKFDMDNDGGLNDQELASLFAPSPGIPTSWIDAAFPSCTVRNEAGYITLQGWLAQWSMTTFEEPKTTLEYLAYLGFEERGGTTSALKVTKARKRRKRPGRVERNVFLCYVLGSIALSVPPTTIQPYIPPDYQTTVSGQQRRTERRQAVLPDPGGTWRTGTRHTRESNQAKCMRHAMLHVRFERSGQFCAYRRTSEEVPSSRPTASSLYSVEGRPGQDDATMRTTA